MGDLSAHRLREIENFFRIYKELEWRQTDVSGWLRPDDAWRIIDAALANARRGHDSEGEPPNPGTWR